MPSRPLLGIIACNRAVGVETAAAVMQRYVVAAGRWVDADIVLIPSIEGLQSARDVTARLDGVLLTGSPSNVQPVRYGDEGLGDGPFDPARDTTALALVDAVIANGLPLWGICRGFQELNVAFGGVLRRDCAGPEATLKHHAPDEWGFNQLFDWWHDVHLVEGGRLATAFGTTTIPIRSVHYQGVARMGDGLTLEASAPDGLVEAFTAQPGKADILAVQWHPEWQPENDINSQKFFAMLGDAMRARAGA